MTKRAYKLQEFVAHTSNVNCLTIGKKSSRVLVTGGEDQKVNMWAIGKPNAILSLSGHTSAVESVTFDAAEVLVVAGAASGTIKLWDLEEAKIVRTLTGHRSNCISVSFHPFGEFFASGSLDTNLKIWDIRRKGCIHTYKGHTRGINTIKFSPDGRWVVSGGEDNAVKLWDLTAGKLMHDFKFHDGQIQSLDFHPHEFLLASGSADRTVKFWDLETFELIGSAGPEATGVRSMIFNPDGRTLLCGMHDSLKGVEPEVHWGDYSYTVHCMWKVLSWEPLRCHDVIDVGWSKLADLSVHEGKLLGCSFQQSCVGVWVVDLTRISPFQAGHAPRAGNNNVGVKANSNGHQVSQQGMAEKVKSNGLNQGIPDMLESAISTMKDVTLATSRAAESVPSTNSRTSTPLSSRSMSATSLAPQSVSTPRRSASTRVHSGNVVRSSSRSDVRDTSSTKPNAEVEPQIQSSAARSEDSSSSKPTGGLTSLAGRPDQRNVEGLRGDAGADAMRIDPGRVDTGSHQAVSTSSSLRGIVNGDRGGHGLNPHVPTSRGGDDGDDSSWNETRKDPSWNEARKDPPWAEMRKFKRSTSLGLHKIEVLHKGPPPSQAIPGDSVSQFSRPASSMEASTTGRPEVPKTRGLIAQWERKERSDVFPMPAHSNNGGVKPLGLDINSYIPRGHMNTDTSGSSLLADEDLIEKLMQQHHTMASIMQSRLTNMQVVRRFWIKNDVKGAMEAMAKLNDHSVLVDVLSVVMERTNVLSLEVSGLLLPPLNDLLCSHNERHVLTAIGLISKLVKTFGQMIHTAISAAPSLGVDLQAEQRLERCKVCHRELQHVGRTLTSLIRKGGEVGNAAQELSLALTEI